MMYSAWRNKQRGVAEVEISVLLLAAMILSLALVDLAQPAYQQQRLQQLSEDLVWLVSAKRQADDFDSNNTSANALIEIDQYQNLLNQLWPQTSAKKQTTPGISIYRLRQGEPARVWDSGTCAGENSGEITHGDLSLLLAPLANGEKPAAWVVILCLPQNNGLASHWFNTGGEGSKAFPTLFARSVLMEREGF